MYCIILAFNVSVSFCMATLLVFQRIQFVQGKVWFGETCREIIVLATGRNRPGRLERAHPEEVVAPVGERVDHVVVDDQLLESEF